MALGEHVSRVDCLELDVVPGVSMPLVLVALDLVRLDEQPCPIPTPQLVHDVSPDFKGPLISCPVLA
jgi:hypothetical protein